jgi:hypothetical protein
VGDLIGTDIASLPPGATLERSLLCVEAARLIDEFADDPAPPPERVRALQIALHRRQVELYREMVEANPRDRAAAGALAYAREQLATLGAGLDTPAAVRPLPLLAEFLDLASLHLDSVGRVRVDETGDAARVETMTAAEFLDEFDLDAQFAGDYRGAHDGEPWFAPDIKAPPQPLSVFLAEVDALLTAAARTTSTTLKGDS